jgi:hypothetical protein
LFGLSAAIFFCPPIGGQKKDFRFYPAALRQKIFIHLLPKRRLTRRKSEYFIMRYNVIDDDGLIALVNANRYETFVNSDWSLEQLKSHFIEQMNKK